MARKFSELRAKMSPEARARVEARVVATLAPNKLLRSEGSSSSHGHEKAPTHLGRHPKGHGGPAQYTRNQKVRHGFSSTNHVERRERNSTGGRSSVCLADPTCRVACAPASAWTR